MNTHRSARLALIPLALAVGAVPGCATNQDSKSAGAPEISGPPVLITSFDAAQGRLPEGLVVGGDGKQAFVGFAPISEVARVDLASGRLESFGTLPRPVPNKGFMTGLQPAPGGGLLAAMVSFAPEVQPGIYRIAPEGGPATLHARHPQMAFPNGFADDGAGGQFVTDSAAGAIFRLGADATLTPWITDPALSGSQDFCGKGVGAGFDIGANGVVRLGTTLYVTNNDRAQVVAIPIQADGSAGAVRVLVGPDCETLGGADGIAAAPEGGLIVAANRLNKLVAVSLEGKLRVVAAGTPLDFPASVAFDGHSLLATNFALFNAAAGKPANPGLIRLGGR
jgi:hypothetical protein